jgi:hypothetical protein
MAFSFTISKPRDINAALRFAKEAGIDALKQAFREQVKNKKDNTVRKFEGGF